MRRRVSPSQLRPGGSPLCLLARCPKRPPCPRAAISQAEIRYRASIGGKIRSTTFGLADEKHPGAETTGILSLYPSSKRLPGSTGAKKRSTSHPAVLQAL